MNPLTHIPPRLRIALYYLYGIGSIAITYLLGKDIIGAAEAGAWTALGVLFGFVAGANVPAGAHRHDIEPG